MRIVVHAPLPFRDIAEQWLSNDGWANFRDWAGHPDADAVIAELEANGSLTPGLNWYRANIPPESYIAPPLALPPIAAPTMGVWSSGDIALTEGQMTRSAAHVRARGATSGSKDRATGCSWKLDDVNRLLLDFLPA